MHTVVCKKLTCFLALCLIQVPAFSMNGHIYAGASIGESFASLGNHTPQISYASGGLITDAYPLNHTRASSPIVSINGGLEFPGFNWKPAIAIGLGAYSSLSNYHYNGQLIETPTGSPSSTLYNYSENVNSERVMAEIQLTWMIGKISPFINFGAGTAWNKMHGYTETPATNNGFVALPPFQSNTNINFAYQAGIGASTAFNFAGTQSDFKQERVSLGYRYAHLGNASFGIRGSVYPYQLNLGSLITNDIYLSYTHLF